MNVYLNRTKLFMTKEIGNKSRFCFVIALLVGLILLSPYLLLLKIQFWMLDDHAFIYWDSLRTDSALQNILRWLHLTNFFNYGDTDRFFPIQNLLKVNQVQFLGMDSMKWFAMNLSLVVLTFGLAVSLVNKIIK